MLIQGNKDGVKDNGKIYKLYTASGFLSVTEAFGIDKIRLEFGKFESPKTKKLGASVAYYISVEDAKYLAYILKTGRIANMCAAAKQQSEYGSGYHEMAGTNGVSRQIKIEQNTTKQGRFFFKALEGPGKKEPNGIIKPLYNDANAEKNICISMDMRQLMTMGLAIDRAISILDMNIAMGEKHLKSFIESMRPALVKDGPRPVNEPEVKRSAAPSPSYPKQSYGSAAPKSYGYGNEAPAPVKSYPMSAAPIESARLEDAF